MQSERARKSLHKTTPCLTLVLISKQDCLGVRTSAKLECVFRMFNMNDFTFQTGCLGPSAIFQDESLDFYCSNNKNHVYKEGKKAWNTVGNEIHMCQKSREVVQNLDAVVI